MMTDLSYGILAGPVNLLEIQRTWVMQFRFSVMESTELQGKTGMLPWEGWPEMGIVLQEEGDSYVV